MEEPFGIQEITKPTDILKNTMLTYD